MDLQPSYNKTLFHPPPLHSHRPTPHTQTHPTKNMNTPTRNNNNNENATPGAPTRGGGVSGDEGPSANEEPSPVYVYQTPINQGTNAVTPNAPNRNTRRRLFQSSP